VTSEGQNQRKKPHYVLLMERRHELLAAGVSPEDPQVPSQEMITELCQAYWRNSYVSTALPNTSLVPAMAFKELAWHEGRVVDVALEEWRGKGYSLRVSSATDVRP